MTERERWVVYPLLFLALGASLRDKLGGRTTTKSIVCQELRVEDEPVGNQTARVLALIGRTEPTAGKPSVGYLMVNGQVGVDGALNVKGTVNANQYFFRGLPMIPAVHAVAPGAALQNLMQAIPQAPTNAPDAAGRPGKSEPPSSPSPAKGAGEKSDRAADAPAADAEQPEN
jgi:hypothetical protein